MRAAPTKSYSPYIGVASFLLEMPKNNEGKLEIDSFYFIFTFSLIILDVCYFLIFSNYLTNEEKEHITQSFLSIDSLLLFISFKLISLNSTIYLYIYMNNIYIAVQWVFFG